MTPIGEGRPGGSLRGVVVLEAGVKATLELRPKCWPILINILNNIRVNYHQWLNTTTSSPMSISANTGNVTSESGSIKQAAKHADYQPVELEPQLSLPDLLIDLDHQLEPKLLDTTTDPD